MFLPTDIKVEPPDTDIKRDAVVIFPYSSSFLEHERKVLAMKDELAAEFEMKDEEKQLKTGLVEASAAVQRKYQHGMKAILEKYVRLAPAPQVTTAHNCDIETEKQLARHCTVQLDVQTQKQQEMEIREMKVQRNAVRRAQWRKRRELETTEQRQAHNAHRREIRAERIALGMKLVDVETEEQRTLRLMKEQQYCEMERSNWRSLIQHNVVIFPYTSSISEHEQKAFVVKDDRNTADFELTDEGKQLKTELVDASAAAKMKFQHTCLVEDKPTRLNEVEASHSKHCCEELEIAEEKVVGLTPQFAATLYRETEQNHDGHCTKQVVLAAQRKEQQDLEMQQLKAQLLIAVKAAGKGKSLKPETVEERVRIRASSRDWHRKRRAMETNEEKQARNARRREIRAARKALCVNLETEDQRTRRLAKAKRFREMKRAKWKSLIQHNDYVALQTQQTETSSQQTNQPPRRAMPQVHWLNVGESPETPMCSLDVIDTAVELYVYKVVNTKLACQLAQEQNKHVYIENSTTTVTVGDDLYPCQHCDKSFKSVYARDNHYHFDHPGVRRLPTKTYLCSICYFTCLHLDKLLSHLADSHQNVYWKLFICGICRKAYMNRGDFQTHCSLHMRLYMCPVCGKTFGTMNYLQQHSLSHSSERLYRCEICDKRFRYKCELRWHILQSRNRTSTDVTSTGLPICATVGRPYQCQQCEKCFRSTLGLKRHVTNLHAEARQFSCTCQFCGQCFLSRQGLKQHEDRKHLQTERRFKCEHCHESFEIKRSLKVHLLAVHSDINIEQPDGKKSVQLS